MKAYECECGTLLEIVRIITDADGCSAVVFAPCRRCLYEHGGGELVRGIEVGEAIERERRARIESAPKG